MRYRIRYHMQFDIACDKKDIASVKNPDDIFTYSVIIQPNLDALLMLNVAAACNFWPLAAKASRLSFTNNLVDEATADEEFPGFHDNAGLMLIFFSTKTSSAWEAHHDHPAWQRPDLSEERSSPRLHLRENRGPPPETILGCSRIQGQWCRRRRL